MPPTASDARSDRNRSSSRATFDTADLSNSPSARPCANWSKASAAARGQVGGPLGAYLLESLLDTPLDYESMAAAGAMLGHGGIVVFDDSVDMARQARFAMEFCAKESCGKCTPCRIGSTRGVETVDKIIAGQDRPKNVQLLRDLCEVMTDGSLCALGGLAPMPVLSALNHFSEDFAKAPTRVAAE